MSRCSLTIAIALLSVAAVAAPAGAHVSRPGASAIGARAAVAPNSDPFTVGPSTPAVVDGPCTEQSARQQYVDGEGHDHLAIEVHAAACRIVQQAFLPLKDELTSDPGTEDDEVLGEMDVEGDVAAVAIAYPRAGILFFDVANPAAPKFLRRYNGPGCEGTVIDVDCGAFVDLSEDGKTAFLSVQQISVIPGANPGGVGDSARPGVQVVDVESGRLTHEQPVLSVGGVHTSRDHVVPEGPSSADQPRDPGHYLFSIANGRGIRISEVVPGPLGPALVDVGEIRIDETHDTFIQDDPLTGRTYLYVAGGFDTGFLVYDVTDPGAAVGTNQQLLAQWDLTPECREDWYSHTIDVAVRGGRRYVTMPAEAFDNGEQPEEDQAKGCGKISGNGDKASPMWIVDATDFDALGRDGYANARDGDGETTAAEVKAASEEALTTTWTNAAARPAQNINFTPHNQQIVGDRIYLSGYHSGVTALDAAAAFAGRNERPKEVGFVVPAGTPTRPIYEQAVDPVIPFFAAFIDFRPLIWDMVVYKGSILAADMTGGFYSFSEPPVDSAPASGSQGGGSGGSGSGEGSGAPVACRSRAGLVSASVRGAGRGGGVRFGFTRRVDRPVLVDVFQKSRGRRIVRDALVRRFSGRTGAFGWNGRGRGGRELSDGVYVVRFRIAVPGGGTDVVRVALRRSKGRFARLGAHNRRDSCGVLGKFKLSRPVFGATQGRALGIAYQLNRGGRVRVVVTDRRGRVVRRFAAEQVAAGRTRRLSLGARGLGRGAYRIELSVRSGAQTTSATLTAHRL